MTSLLRRSALTFSRRLPSSTIPTTTSTTCHPAASATTAAATKLCRATFTTTRSWRDVEGKTGRPDVAVPGQSKTPTGKKVMMIDPQSTKPEQPMVPLEEVRGFEDLIGCGAEPGTVPTDLEQATGLERLEILGKMQGIDIFDMKPLDASRLGTLADPIRVKSFGDEQFAGCTGFPADSHVVRWCLMTRKHPIGRCKECGSTYRMDYVGPPDDPHHHHEHYEEPYNFSDYVKPEYRDRGRTPDGEWA